MEPLSIERSVLIAAAPERVWRAVTEASELERWYAPGCPWEIPALRAGAEVRFFNTPEDVQHATILELEPQHRLVLRWHLEAQYPASQLTTAFQLEPEEGGTRVTITESGFETLPAEARAESVEHTGAGYAVALETLKTLLEGVPA